MYTGTRGLAIYKTFESMSLPEELLRGIYSYGFSKPSAIQSRVIVPILQARDVIVQSPSGTGKSASFCIPLLARLNSSKNEPQGLVISPTRELAEQTGNVLSGLGDYMKAKTLTCVGGKSVGADIKALERGVQFISGTPGRCFDLIRRGQLSPKHMKVLVIDEADEMFTAGFKEQLYDIYRYMPSGCQVVLVSATLPAEVLDMTSKFMTEPVEVLVRRDEVALEGIRQFYVDVDKEEWKFETLCDLYSSFPIAQAVIFCNTRRKVDWLTTKLRQAQFTVCSMHGDMSQKDRDAVMSEFRSGRSRVLVTTDIWGRGIDVQQVSLVVNYDIPTNKENYIHRIGRSGRFGRKGVAINFVCSHERPMLKELEHHYATRIAELPASLADLF